MHDSLLKKGYGGPIATPGTLEIDEMVKRKWVTSGASLVALMTQLIDMILVCDVSDIANGSDDYLGVMHISLRFGEIVMVVPWLHQYDEGGQICIYRKGDMEVMEIDAVLVQLIEYVEVNQATYN
jgi:hypothetical protein